MVQSLAHLIVKARIGRRTWLNVNCSFLRAVSEAFGSTLSPLAASAISHVAVESFAGTNVYYQWRFGLRSKFESSLNGLKFTIDISTRS